MDNSPSVIGRGIAPTRYIMEQGPSSRFAVSQDSVVMKRPMPGFPPAYRPAAQRFPPGHNNRLVAQAPESPTPNGQALKRSFTADYQADFQNQANRFSRTVDKSKGLRHFSTKVCEKVKEKGRTNYNEVADELVSEYFDSLSMPMSDSDKQTYDMKNIRRRVYDALNVLMAMNIIEKEKKEIRWVGLPTSSIQECRRLEDEKARRAERIKEKTDSLFDLVMQLVAYKSLVERNRERERTEGRPADNAILFLPFVVVNTDKSTVVECNISPDKAEYGFHFDHPFEIQDDIEVLKRLGFAQGLETGVVSDEIRPKIKNCLPNSLRPYIDPIIEVYSGGAFAPVRQLYQQRPMDMQKKAMILTTQPAPYGVPRPVMRVTRPIQGQTTSVTVPRYTRQMVPTLAPPPPNQTQRFIQSNMTPRPQSQQGSYTYAQSANGGQKPYMVRQMYAAPGGQYMEEMYEDEEEMEAYE